MARLMQNLAITMISDVFFEELFNGDDVLYIMLYAL